MSLTLEQVRMKVGYDATRALLSDNGPAEQRAAAKAWKTVAVPFGAHVQRDGLLQALAFLARSAGDVALNTARGRLLMSVRAHLFERQLVVANPTRGLSDQTDLLEITSMLDATEYMQVTREVLALSLWFKRAAQALCGDDDA